MPPLHKLTCLVDVSHWTDSSKIQTLRHLCIARRIALVAKLTEGANNVDESAVKWLAPVKQPATLFGGVYHFLEDSPAGEQFDHYLATLKRLFPGRKLLSTLDFEAGENGRHTPSLGVAVEFANLHFHHLGHLPVLYGPKSLVSPLADELHKMFGYVPVRWIADYSEEPPTCPWDIWQFSEKGSITLEAWKGDVSTFRPGLRVGDLWHLHGIDVPRS